MEERGFWPTLVVDWGVGGTLDAPNLCTHTKSRGTMGGGCFYKEKKKGPINLFSYTHTHIYISLP